MDLIIQFESGIEFMSLGIHELLKFIEKQRTKSHYNKLSVIMFNVKSKKKCEY